MKRNLFMLVTTGLIVSGCGQQPSSPPASPPRETVHSSPSAVTSPDSRQAATPKSDALEKGIQHLQDGELEGAIQSFDQAIRENPLDPQPYLVLGQTYMRLRDYPRAVDTLSAAARVTPDSGEVHYLLAVNQGLMGDLETARTNAQKSVEIFGTSKDEENFKQALVLLQGLITAQNAGDEVDEQAVTSTMEPQL